MSISTWITGIAENHNNFFQRISGAAAPLQRGTLAAAFLPTLRESPPCPSLKDRVSAQPGATSNTLGISEKWEQHTSAREGPALERQQDMMTTPPPPHHYLFVRTLISKCVYPSINVCVCVCVCVISAVGDKDESYLNRGGHPLSRKELHVYEETHGLQQHLWVVSIIPDVLREGWVRTRREWGRGAVQSRRSGERDSGGVTACGACGAAGIGQWRYTAVREAGGIPGCILFIEQCLWNCWLLWLHACVWIRLWGKPQSLSLSTAKLRAPLTRAGFWTSASDRQ